MIVGMIRKPSPALTRTYVSRTKTGRFQARATIPQAKRDVKYTADTPGEAVRGARRLAARARA